MTQKNINQKLCFRFNTFWSIVIVIATIFTGAYTLTTIKQVLGIEILSTATNAEVMWSLSHILYGIAIAGILMITLIPKRK